MSIRVIAIAIGLMLTKNTKEVTIDRHRFSPPPKPSDCFNAGWKQRCRISGEMMSSKLSSIQRLDSSVKNSGSSPGNNSDDEKPLEKDEIEERLKRDSSNSAEPHVCLERSETLLQHSVRTKAYPAG